MRGIGLIRPRESELRRPRDEVALGPRYEGSRVSRDALMGEESDDDPFGSGASAQSDTEEEEDVMDPEDGDGDVDVDVDGGEVEEDEDIDSDEAFGESDTERFKDFSFKGSKRSGGVNGVGGANNGIDGKKGQEMERSDSESEDSLLKGSEGIPSDDGGLDVAGVSEEEEVVSEDHDDSSQDGSAEQLEEDDDEDEDEDGNAPKIRDDRAELRKMMTEEQKTVVATISQAAKADAEKGKAVKHQRSTFDALLNTRIRLQKALIATNSMSALKTSPPVPDDAREAIRAAEEAALKLWNQLDHLRHDLSSSQHQTGTKRKRDPPAQPSTPTTTLWQRMQLHESTSLPHRRSTLEKWSTKLRPVAVLPPSRKLINTPTTHTLTSVLDDHLSNTNAPRLVTRTRTPRSCAPLQAQSGVTESVDIFDDADFYALLLKELVDQRMADSAVGAGISSVAPGMSMAMQREAKVKTRKKVDTKASKGRKMRYTVYERLQNFMASEDRGSWGSRQVDELFGGLLGVRVRLGEDVGGDENSEVDGGEEGLRLFRS